MGRRGFSLIELLVVIAVIALLAMILYPAFFTARAKAYQTACLSNQQQLGKAFAMYAADNDERMPILLGTPVPWPAWGGAPAPFWYAVLQPYLHSTAVLVCRADTGIPHKVISPSAPPYACSYAPNVYLDRASDAAVVEPAATVLLADGALNYAFRANDSRTGTPQPHYHSQGFNALFYDGHSRWRATETPDPSYHWAREYPTPNTGGF